MKLNWGSVKQKVKERLEQPDMVKKMDSWVDEKMLSDRTVYMRNGTVMPTPVEAASKFISVLWLTISALRSPDGYSPGLLGPAAIEALSDIDYTSPHKIGRGRYSIGIYFVNDMSRMSLYPEKYDGIDNIAALLNNGFGPTRGSVYGVWHGKHIEGLRKRVGAGFMQQARSDFLGNYGSDLGVETINFDDLYE